MGTNLKAGERGLEALLEEIVSRLEVLETKRAVVVGAYRLREDDGGRLIAEHLPTHTSVVIMDPYSGPDPSGATGEIIPDP